MARSNNNNTIFNPKAVAEKMPPKLWEGITQFFTFYQKVNFFFQGFDESLDEDSLDALEKLAVKEHEDLMKRIELIRKEAAKKEKALKKAS